MSNYFSDLTWLHTQGDLTNKLDWPYFTVKYLVFLEYLLFVLTFEKAPTF